MAEKFQWALTPSNLAKIGAIDDFYDLYVFIQELYEYQRKVCTAVYGESWALQPDAWDNSCRREVRRACEPIMNKYLCMFVGGYSKIFANSYGFARFSFLRYKPLLDTCPPYGRRIFIGFISFAQFLIEIQYAITRIIHRWKTSVQSDYPFKEMCDEINDHILAYVHEHTEVEILTDGESAIVMDAVLNVYENLSGISCRLREHPIVPEKFVADFASGSGKIALPVHYCRECNKYFIGKTTLQLFEKDYGKMLVKRHRMKSEGDAFASLSEESLLFQLGYNVSDNRSDSDRQKLLVTLLEKKCISYIDMVKTIEFNIKVHYDKPLAVQKWKRDLKYIGDYIVKIKS